MYRLVVFGASLLLIIAGVVPQRAGAAGRADLTGEEVLEVVPSCSKGESNCELHRLSAIRYAAAGTTANVVSFTSLKAQGGYVCDPGVTTPSHCERARTSETFVINETNAIVTRHGLCRQVTGRLSACNSYTEFDTIVDALSPLPVSFDLGSGNDTFTAEDDPAQGWPIVFDVRTGNGNDTVVLIDAVPGAADTISCGSGVDRVVTLASTTVASDCESVTRL